MDYDYEDIVHDVLLGISNQQVKEQEANSGQPSSNQTSLKEIVQNKVSLDKVLNEQMDLSEQVMRSISQVESSLQQDLKFKYLSLIILVGAPFNQQNSILLFTEQLQTKIRQKFKEFRNHPMAVLTQNPFQN
mmetsp:Transcript_13971/g.23751  ORF Transcript_13971/g.23751 Transcript_13971/m.23751 type:complete len:132 (-) Transcript_13971:503-898(-)